MKQRKAKLFLCAGSFPNNVICIPIDEKIEYYAFLRQCHIEGHRQIIITSELMIEIIKHYVIDLGYKISSIVFMEDDNELLDEMNILIEASLSNSAYISRVIDKLIFLSEKSSIEIQRLYVKGRSPKGDAVNFFIQSNGIISTDICSYENTTREIAALLEKKKFAQ